MYHNLPISVSTLHYPLGVGRSLQYRPPVCIWISPGLSSFSSLALSSLIWDVLDSLGDAQWPLCYLQLPTQGTHLALAILSGSTHGVCDGSYMPSFCHDLGATAWFLEDSHSPGLHTCYGFLHGTGDPGISYTYWAELQGMHALLLALHFIFQAFSLPSGSSWSQ